MINDQHDVIRQLAALVIRAAEIREKSWTNGIGHIRITGHYTKDMEQAFAEAGQELDIHEDLWTPFSVALHNNWNEILTWAEGMIKKYDQK